MYTCGHCGAPTTDSHKISSIDHASHTCDKCWEQIVQEVAYQSENKHFREATVICPHCDYDYESYDSYTDFEPGDDLEKVICPECGKAFELEVEEIRYFSTKKHVCEMPEEESEVN